MALTTSTSASASPGRSRAHQHFDFGEPWLEYVGPENAVLSWREPKLRNPAAFLAALDSATPRQGKSPRPLTSPTMGSSNAGLGGGTGAGAASGAADGTDVKWLRRYYVEYRAASAPEYVLLETSHCHAVVPIDHWGEAIHLRVSFRQAPVVSNSLSAAVDALIRSELFIGERVAFQMQRPPVAHPLLLPCVPTPAMVATNESAASAALVSEAMSGCHPLLLLCLASATVQGTEPTAAARGALKALGGHDNDLHDAVRCLGFDTVSGIKVAALSVDLTVDGMRLAWDRLVPPHNASDDSPAPFATVVRTAKRAIVIVSSEGIDHSSHHNNRSVSPDRKSLDVETEAVTSWLVDGSTIVVTTGFGAHGTSAVRVGQGLNRLVLKPSKYQQSNVLSEALATEIARAAASKRVMSVAFCSAMERFMDPAKERPVPPSASDAATRCLFVMPRADAVPSRMAAAAAAGAQAASAQASAADSSKAAQQAQRGGIKPTIGDPFERVKQRLPLAQSDTDLGIPVDFVVDPLSGACGVCVGHGTTDRSADDEQIQLEVCAANTSLIARLKQQLLAAAQGVVLADAVGRLAPHIESVLVRSGRGTDYLIDVRGWHLEGILAASIAFDDPSSTTSDGEQQQDGGRDRIHAVAEPVVQDLDLEQARCNSDRVVLQVHLAVLTRFVHPRKAATGTATLGLFVASDSGCAYRSGISVQLPATLTPFILANRLTATTRDEPFAETPHDAVTGLLRMEALSLIAPIGGTPERAARILTTLDRCAAALELGPHKSKVSGSSVKSVFQRFAQTAAAKISSDPISSKDIIVVPTAAATQDHVRRELQACSSAQGGGSSRIPAPDSVLDKFGPMLKRWMTHMPYLSAADIYARKVLELCALLRIPIPPNEAEAVITNSSFGQSLHSESGDFTSGAPPLLGLCTVEALLYHHICGHITQIGVKTVPAHAVLSDHVSIAGFVADFSRVLLGTDKYADAKANDASNVFEDAVALYAVCHIFAARVAEQFTRFTGVAGPVGSGVSSVLRTVAGVEEREGESVTRSVLGNTVVRELPFTLPHLLLALNLFHSVSIVIVLEDADCAANGTVADVIEAVGSLCATRQSRKQHVGVFISKLDDYLRRHPTALVKVDGDDADEAGMASLQVTAAAVALNAMTRIQQGATGDPCWDHVAAVAGAVMPRVDVPGIAQAAFVEHATNSLRINVLASNV